MGALWAARNATFGPVEAIRVAVTPRIPMGPPKLQSLNHARMWLKHSAVEPFTNRRFRRAVSKHGQRTYEPQATVPTTSKSFSFANE